MTGQVSLLPELAWVVRTERPGSLGRQVGVMTWNVQHAAAGRAWRQVEWLAAQDKADVVVLTEVPAAGDAHATALAAHGYLVACPEPGGDHRVLVAARTGEVTVVEGLYTGGLSTRWLAVCAVLPGGSTLGVVGLYVPSRGPRERRNVTKRAFQADVTAVLPTLGESFGPDTPVIVTGDLNVVEPDHQPHHAVFGGWEYAFYRSFAEAGFTDAFRHLNPRAIEHSWYGRAGRGYRFDHLFCSAGHLDTLTDCRYLHQPREQRLSDHSALAATLQSSYAPG